MKEKPSYLAAAFNARPLGMPIPPNWFGIAAFGLLGALINPGPVAHRRSASEGLYLWWLSKNERFRATVDAERGLHRQHVALREPARAPRLGARSRSSTKSSGRPRRSSQLLQRSEAHGSQIGDVRQMAWLHLKLLAARAAFAEVVEVADRERKKLDEQERRCRERLAASDTDDELRRSPRAADRSHPVAPRRARRCQAPHGAGRRRARPPAPAGLAGARAGAARHRRQQHGAVARRAVARRSTRPIAGSRISANCSRASTISPTSRRRRICWLRSARTRRASKVSE